MAIKIPRPPKHLTKEAKNLWKAILEDYSLEASERATLKTALEHYDRMNAAREVITAEGFTITDPSGRARVHPAVQVEKEARSGFLQAWRLLALNEEPPRPGPGRPPGR